MLRWFETRIDPFRETAEARPPSTLLAFYWHYVRQAWPVFTGVLISGFLGALIDVALFAFLGQIVDMIRDAESPKAFFDEHGQTLIWMAVITLVIRPIVFASHSLCINQGVVPPFTNLIRWQTHRYVLRQSLSFFNNDFAGRVANKVMQTGPALRESVVETTDAIWFVSIYTLGGLYFFAQADPWLMAPMILWVCVYILVLWYFVPRIKTRAAIMSEARSSLTGRVVDSYTNILTVKLFAHATREDEFARQAMQEHTARFHDQVRMITVMTSVVWVMNGMLIVGTAALALWLWGAGMITVGAVALATGLVIRINGMSAWIMWAVTRIFENIGTVQEGMETISRSHAVVDVSHAKPLTVTRGEVCFDRVRFHYGKGSGVIDNFSLTVQPGEKVGLVGRSGAGKSTVVNLMLRFYDLEGGRLTIDDQDIAKVSQDSLRSQIGMVTQDTSLLHRSVMENVLYGRPDATEAAAIAAAEKAHADEFIRELVDPNGRRGYQAHVGERGVKLSGGQRQRIAIARALLKDAPILLLDEATSALDSEVEAAIQEQFYNLMAGKTVIAIAHRLSTIAAMDRLVIMDKGAIVEEGTHEALLKENGLYAQLWARQSGGFLAYESTA
jgi:ATP-binding cassette subfamily B multidrug efflux pump